MNENHSEPARVGAREAGRQLGVSHSYLLRLAKDGRLPRSADGSFDVEECRRVLASETDPAQVRGDRPLRWSQPGHSVTTKVNGDQPRPRFEAIPAGPVPNPDYYRGRTDLPDDFARGALYGAHAVAHQIPHAAALVLHDHGATHAEQIAAFRSEADAAFLYVKAPMVALGVEDEDAEEPTALSPTAFLGFTAGGGTGV